MSTESIDLLSIFVEIRTHMTIRFITFFLLFLISFVEGIGQAIDYQQIVDDALNITNTTKSRHAGAIDYRVSDGHYDAKAQLHFIYIQDHLYDIPIKYQVKAMVTDANGAIVLKPELFIQRAKTSKRTLKRAKINSRKAISQALKSLNAKEPSDLILLKSNSGKSTFIAKSISEELITTRLTYVIKDGEYKLCWEIALYIDELEQWWEVIIDADTGQHVDQHAWTISCFDQADSCELIHDYSHASLANHTGENNHTSDLVSCDSSYNVYALPAAHPEEAGRSIVTRPWGIAPLASPFGWHQDSSTAGNNVFAYDDISATNLPGTFAIGTLEYCFDFTIDLNLDPSSYTAAAITNLFYTNNMVHDIMYGYGFDEAAGNFQKINSSGQGVGEDYVRAEAQDGSGLNNANFSTPPEGFRPRMQMFNWITEGRKFEITSPASIAQFIPSTGATFGNQSMTVTGEIVAVDPALACSEILNPTALVGKIALIDRGDCFYVEKVARAQTAGAIAMIVCQYDTVANLLTMGGDTSLAINIPAVMISGAHCDTIRNVLDTAAVEVTISPPSLRDSDLDNLVIIHEYAHGISTRLTGGAANSSCLNNAEQMGEGWSDWYGLMLTMKEGDTPTQARGIGTYLLAQSNSSTGIRQYPYSTDLNLNPATYVQLPQSAVVHRIGQIWASMLWDMTWALIDLHGFDSDVYFGDGGNNIALQLVTTALKLQPCSPGFVDGRDAILRADQLLYGGRHACLIWEAFARRGLGYTADQGSSDDISDGSPATDMPPICSQDYVLFKRSSERIIGEEDTISFSIIANGYQNTIASSLSLVDSMSTGLEMISGSLNLGTSMGQLINYNDPTFAKDSQRLLTYQAQLSPTAEISILNYTEGFESDEGMWSPTGDSITWSRVDSLAHTGRYTFFARGVENDVDQFLVSAPIVVTEDLLMSFWHQYDMETFWDGGFVELQIVGDTVWQDLGSRFLQNGYSDRLFSSSNPLSTERYAFTGNSGGYIQSWVDLTGYIGQTITLRFYYGSDLFVFGDGWRIDDIALYQARSSSNYVTSTYGNLVVRDTVTVYHIPSCEVCMLDPCEIELLTVNVIDATVYKARSGVILNRVGLTGSLSSITAGDSIIVYPTMEVPQNGVLSFYIEDCPE